MLNIVVLLPLYNELSGYFVLRCISHLLPLKLCLVSPPPSNVKNHRFLIILINKIFSASYPALCGCRVADPHHLDAYADTDPAFHFDADQVCILPFTLMRIRILPFNLMRIRTQILPLIFFQILTLQCSIMASKACPFSFRCGSGSCFSL
jgi:hypothetical protein